MKILIVTDSNGQMLKPELLKPAPDAQVNFAHNKYTVTDALNAVETVPYYGNPETVTDIIFQVGLNDTRQGVSSDKICNQTFEMQMAYSKKFTKARQHIVALPPLDDAQIEINNQLQKLCNHTKSNFVSTKAFRDRVTGRLRRNLMIHERLPLQ